MPDGSPVWPWYVLLVIGYVGLCYLISAWLAGETGRREAIPIGMLLGPLGWLLIAALGRTPEADAEYRRRRAEFEQPRVGIGSLNRPPGVNEDVWDGLRRQNEAKLAQAAMREKQDRNEELERFKNWRKESAQ